MGLLFRRSTISAAFPLQISLLLWSSYSADRPFRQLFPSNLATFMELLFRRSTISAAFPLKSRYFYGAPIPQIDQVGSFPPQISLLLWSSYSADRPFRQLSPSNLVTFMELLFRGTISNDRNKVWVGIARSK